MLGFKTYIIYESLRSIFLKTEPYAQERAFRESEE